MTIDSFDPVKIREAKPGEMDALADLHLVVQDLHVRHEPDIFAPSDWRALREHIRRLFAEVSVRMWVAEDGDRLLGFIVAVQKERVTPFHQPRRWLEIDQIIVSPAARGRGVGRKLLEAAEDHARRCGIGHVELTSWTFNVEAHEFFRRGGYEPKVIRFVKRL